MADDGKMEEEQLYEDGYEDEIPIEGQEEFAGTGGAEELEAMKKKLKEMEDEAARLKAMQASVAGEAGTSQGAAGGAAAPDLAAKEEIDGRSVYVGNVDYACTPEELQQLFQSCGTVNRVTILTDKFGSPKGYAYIEFLEVDAVANAVLLDGSELRGRQIKVVQKRTNVPGLKAPRGRGGFRGGFAGG
eukprot:CAMPEP_0202900782 /NCGR_PEP_ID=MMETSP1392-20130828/12033_1 /ASSEMBLY_ACC=CAM_ASM_000868 /TAXON_ID=225041 /ORGANISM="Chlamydomonas chlamydogama, Strain SAG 11-48b" /LENGTH=187 /DNA_ID=CAMNT_0049587225 /DNA_START=81 /DNA_END=641 /DNA_ORIENTATION=+